MKRSPTMLIDKQEHITPAGLQIAANNLEYTGRKHEANIIRWCANIIEDYEERDKTQEAYREKL